jgi:hypothetical protein
MALNWLEDVVSHLYRLKGYLVVENEDLQMPQTENRRVRGHSDIDVMAIKDGELVHIECQSWWGPARDEIEGVLQRLKDRFEHAPEVIFARYPFLGGFTVKRVFVTSGKPKRSRGSGPWDRLEAFCAANGIELLEVNDVIEALISEFRVKYPRPAEIGREVGIARFLLHLIHNDFLK